MANDTKRSINPFWPLLVGLLIILGFIVFFSDVFTGRSSAPEEVPVPSTEWTTAPEGGVEVDLPETTIVPAETETEGSGEDQEQPPAE